ncbi:MAG: hypothetical protein GY797_24180 [Deltaproteobacteria bacterium]|nr:hypothetical protein [Deltaproteobacteria bacterium]
MNNPQENKITLADNQDIVIASGVQDLMKLIRPEWQSKNLVQRVKKLLPIDPSSACQRLFNAAIHDLKKKILIAGIDIAIEAANTNKLPHINRPEDIEDYNVSKTIDLAYYMGLISRPVWRRITRVYDIRRDLEHEDDEYEATIEDCFYIFKTAIESVLAKDPIELLRLTDIKEIVEQSSAITLDHTLKDEYGSAPPVRQAEIYKFLISTSLSDKHPDVVRQNCYIAISALSHITKDQVKIEVSQIYSEKVKRKGLDVFTARISFASGILPYFKKSVLKTFYTSYLNHMKSIGYSFKSNNKHGDLLREFREVGGLENCYDDILHDLVEWLCLCYIGEHSYGRYESINKAFYSYSGAPLALEILKNAKVKISPFVSDLISKSKDIKNSCKWQACQRRSQEIIDEIE